MAKGARNRALSQLAEHETRGLPRSFTKSIARKLRKQLYKTKYTTPVPFGGTHTGSRIPPTLAKHKSMQGYRRSMKKASNRAFLDALAKTTPSVTGGHRIPLWIIAGSAILLLTVIITLAVTLR